MAHYTKEELELYRNRRMSVLGRISCAAHLKECSSCSKLLNELEDDEKLVRDLRSSLKTFEEIAKQFPEKHAVRSSAR